MVALRLGYEEAVLLMLEAAPAAARLPHSDGSLPLHHAARWGMTTATQRLLQLAPETAAVQAGSAKCTPLHGAAGGE
jgi:hypothetical protein